MHSLLLIFFGVAFVSSQTIEDPAFTNIGTFTTYQGQTKTYFLPKLFRTQWTNHRAVCQSYGMESLSLESAIEADQFLGLCKQKAALFESWTLVGAFAIQGANADAWYWANSGKHVDHILKWLPNEPDNFESDQYCLAIGKPASNNFGFSDIFCNARRSNNEANDWKFICQRVDGGDDGNSCKKPPKKCSCNCKDYCEF